MQKKCLACEKGFEVTEIDLSFYQKVSPKINGQFFEVSPPKFCPDCRSQRRMAWMNPINLYQRKCDATQKIIVTNFSPEKKYKIYELDYWWSDAWDAKKYGRDFDFTRTFFEQFVELMQETPLPPLIKDHTRDENSDYCNQAGSNKNCYLIFDSDFNRDCYYSYSLNNCENVVDCFRLEKSELCYECIDCVNCYNSKFLQNSTNCSDSLFLKNCIGCADCFGCVNLRNKKYYIFNQEYSKEEYLSKIKEMHLEDWSVLQEYKNKFQDFAKNFPHKFMQGVQNENVTGNYLTNCKNAHDCFDSRNLWDCKNIQQAFETAKDCMDCTEIGVSAELLYECVLCGSPSNQNIFCCSCLPNLSNSLYCYYSIFSSDLFGCVSLKRAKYCILNKQYSKEEYEELVPKIIAHMQKTGEWGEFFPAEISPFAYNETLAQEYFPLTKEDVLNTRSKWWDSLSPPDKGDLGGLNTITPLAPLIRGEQSQGWRWREEEDKISDVKKIIPAERLPDKISDIPDDILNWAIKCEKTGRPFKIQKAELEFYRKMNLPIPRFCFDVRHAMRVEKRNSRKLWQRICDDCKIKIETTYAPDGPEKVLCEVCYLKAIN